jgi:single-strand DNA-binding protein
VLWGRRAEALAPYLFKGLPVYIEGRTETRAWEDDEGTTRYRTEVRVDTIVFLGSDRSPRREPPAEGEVGA